MIATTSNGRGHQVGAPVILLLAPAAYPLGGVADWIDYILRGLEAGGARCVLGLAAGRHHPVDPYLTRHPWHDVSRLTNPTGSREGRIHSLMRTIRSLSPDIVMVVNIVDAYEAVRRLRIEGADVPKIVMTLHGLQGDLMEDISAARDVLDGVVVTNRLTQKLAAEKLGAKDRVHYASYGVLPQPEMSGFNVSPPGKIRLLYCGRLDQSQKRVFDLPVLLRRLHDMGKIITLSIAGDGPDRDALKEKFRQVQLEQYVEFLGVLDAEALAKAYRSSDALIVVSVWETGPIVAWEAMSHGLPVITSRYVGCGLENALIDNVNSLMFPVGDMDAAAKAVAQLDLPNLRARLRVGGFDLVRTRYSRPVSIGQWQTAIEDVLALPTLPIPKARLPSRPSGRLDRLLGVRNAERVRRMIGVGFRHSDAGGEWPHTLHAGVNEAKWLVAAGKADGMGAMQ